MNLIYTKSYDNSLKKLNKKHKEKLELNNILNYLYNIDNFSNLINNPLAKLYGFERLKYNYNEFYSFRISKLIRLIVKPNNNELEIYLIYISTKHYDDFNIEKVIYYE